MELSNVYAANLISASAATIRIALAMLGISDAKAKKLTESKINL